MYINMKQISFLSVKVGMFKGKELNLRAEPGTVNTTGDNLFLRYFFCFNLFNMSLPVN